MSKIKVKFFQLFDPANVQKVNPELEKLVDLPTKRASLKYDLNIKLNQAVTKALKDFDTMRKKLCEDNSRVKEVEFVSGKKTKTMMKIVDAKEEDLKKAGNCADVLIAKIDNIEIDGEKDKVIAAAYDVIDMNEFNKQFNELLQTEIELECYEIRLSKLEEEDCSTLDFAVLQPFLEDDRK